MNNQKELESASAAAPATLTNPFSILPFQALFWPARFAPSSDLLPHVPALWWIVTSLNPLRTAVLGCGDGVLHFAVCQALEKLGSDGRCVGYGFWANPDTSKPLTAAPTGLQVHEEMLYEGVSRLVPVRSVESALAEMRARPVSFLCVDTGALGDAGDIEVQALMESITDDGALLILKGRQAELPRPSVPLVDIECVEIGLGASLWLRKEGKSRLGALVVDNGQDKVLSSDIRAVFRRSGQALVSAAKGKALAQLRGRMKKTQANAEAELALMQSSLDAQRETAQRQAQRLIELQSEVFDLRRSLKDLRAAQEEARVAEARSCARMDTHLLELGRALHGIESEASAEQDEEVRLQSLISDVAVLVAARDAALAEVAVVKTQANAAAELHVDEVVQLTRIAEEWRARVADHSALGLERDSFREQLQAALRKISSQRRARTQDAHKFRARLRRIAREFRKTAGELAIWKARASALQAELGEMRTSTSWKITEPVRGIGRLIFKRGRQRG